MLSQEWQTIQEDGETLLLHQPSGERFKLTEQELIDLIPQIDLSQVISPREMDCIISAYERSKL